MFLWMHLIILVGARELGSLVFGLGCRLFGAVEFNVQNVAYNSRPREHCVQSCDYTIRCSVLIKKWKPLQCRMYAIEKELAKKNYSSGFIFLDP